MIDWLMPLALQTTQGLVLAHAAAATARAPHLDTDRRLDRKDVRHKLTGAEREAFRRLRIYFYTSSRSLL
jgi:hypothetical protein